MEDNQNVQKDHTRFTTAGRKDWKLMLESKNKAAIEAAKNKAKLHKVGAGHMGKQGNAGVIPSKVDKEKQKRVKDVKEVDEATTSGGPDGVVTTGGFAGRMAAGGTTKRPLNELEDEVVSVGVPSAEMTGEVVGAEGAEQPTSPKIESIEKKRAKLEQQMADLEEEKLRVIKLSQLATQKAALQEQLAAIKEEMADVKSGKGETGGIPSAEENVEGAAHEASETPEEEKAEHAEGESEEDESEEGQEKDEKEDSDKDDVDDKEDK